MQAGKFNVVSDLQFGSTAKGKIATFLADTHNVSVITTTNMANAGHVSVIGDLKFVGKALPSVAILRKAKNKLVKVFIGPSAGFEINQLFKEMEETGLSKDDIVIHPRAGIIQQHHKEQEAVEMKHIASTMQGCGAMMREKIQRGSDVKLARNFEELAGMVAPEWKFSVMLMDLMDGGATVLHEGAQGFSLDINHGHSYPFCTSRGCTALVAMADLGIAPKYLGDIYGVLRAGHAIRVGNVKENDKIVGYSGDWYPDQYEMSWDAIKKDCGCPDEHELVEFTTVTQRLRRCASMSMDALKLACRVNGVTRLAVNFVNYLDWSCYRAKGTSFIHLPEKIKTFIEHVEQETRISVAIAGTGPENSEVFTNDC